MKRLSDREVFKMFTRLELRQASDIRDSVQAYLVGRTPEEVAEQIGMPKTLVKHLSTDDDGRLLDCILWLRRKEKETEQQK